MGDFPVGMRVCTTLVSGVVPRKYGTVIEYDPDDLTPYHWHVQYDDGRTEWHDEDSIMEAPGDH